jgi:hypothetical protein
MLPSVGPKAKPQPRALTREDLLRVMPAEEADELLADARAESRGEAGPTVTMTVEEFERWVVQGPDEPLSEP